MSLRQLCPRSVSSHCLSRSQRWQQRGPQFIIATHSPILLGIPGAEILSFDEGEVRPCRYEETESYQVTEMFMNNREKLTERLLRNEG